MTSRSVLSYSPGYPFTVETLQPDSELAFMAAILTEAGHETTVIDRGVLETFDRLYPKELRSPLVQLAAHLFSSDGAEAQPELPPRWRARGLINEIRKQQERVCAETVSEILRAGAVDFVGIKIQHLKDAENARSLVAALRNHRPSTPIMAFGAYFRNLGERVLQSVKEFDFICLGHPDYGLAELADAIRSRRPPRHVPNIAYRDGACLRITAPRATPNPHELPTPTYDPHCYPALEQKTFIKIFNLGAARPVNIVEENLLKSCRVSKAPHGIFQEIDRLKATFGARAFYIAGGCSGAGAWQAIASELMANKAFIRFMLDASIGQADSASLGTLKSAGCLGLAFQIDSGSQRLLDDHYQSGFSVTQAEQALRASKYSSLYTIAKITYPSPADDYHTRHETIRLLERTRPHAATVAIPWEFAGRNLLKYRKTIFPPNTRKTYRYTREARKLRVEIEELGISTKVSAQLVLMATLAGYEGREQSFADQIRYQLLTGDSVGLAALVELINREACSERATISFNPFKMYQNVVGN